MYVCPVYRGGWHITHTASADPPPLTWPSCRGDNNMTDNNRHPSQASVTPLYNTEYTQLIFPPSLARMHKRTPVKETLLCGIRMIWFDADFLVIYITSIEYLVNNTISTLQSWSVRKMMTIIVIWPSYVYKEGGLKNCLHFHLKGGSNMTTSWRVDGNILFYILTKFTSKTMRTVKLHYTYYFTFSFIQYFETSFWMKFFNFLSRVK